MLGHYFSTYDSFDHVNMIDFWFQKKKEGLTITDRQPTLMDYISLELYVSNYVGFQNGLSPHVHELGFHKHFAFGVSEI